MREVGPSAEQLLVVLFVVAIVVAGVIGSAVATRRQKVRRAALAGWASAMGFAYAAGDPELVNAFPGPPFTHGSSRRANEVVRGPWRGRPALAFHYRYRTTNGNNTSTHYYSIVALGLAAPLPPLVVTPKGLAGHLRDALAGGPDIELDDETFTDLFRVQGDPGFARAVLRPATTLRLLGDEPVHWRTSGAWLVLWQQGRSEPPDLERRLDLLAAIADAIPIR